MAGFDLEEFRAQSNGSNRKQPGKAGSWTILLTMN